MKVAIVHYHLNPGGVTSVVENTIAAWKTLGLDIEPVILTGRAYQIGDLENVVEVPGLDYTELLEQKLTANALLQNIETAVRSVLGSLPDVWHIHNHSLGKNAVFADVVNKLASRNDELLLQVHDFAEDGRPGNYNFLRQHISRISHLYPSGPNVFYGLLNNRDYELMAKCGVPETHLCLLPNPVSLREKSELDEKILDLPGDQFFLYPVRAVRRKNMGELALHASISEEGQVFANSLGPTNTRLLPIFDYWKNFVKTNNLPVHYGYSDGRDISFEQLVYSSTSLISTSVAEGFGLAFLEPWLFGKSLTGRNLTDITKDFSNKGVDLSHLYKRLNIPIEWIGEFQVKGILNIALQKTFEAYNVELEEDTLDETYNAFVQNGEIDFGLLDERLQESVIISVINSPEKKNYLKSKQYLAFPGDAVVSANAEVIKTQYSLESYGNKLDDCYQKMLNHPSDSEEWKVSPEEILEAFLTPSFFNLLRT